MVSNWKLINAERERDILKECIGSAKFRLNVLLKKGNVSNQRFFIRIYMSYVGHI